MPIMKMETARSTQPHKMIWTISKHLCKYLSSVYADVRNLAKSTIV